MTRDERKAWIDVLRSVNRTDLTVHYYRANVIEKLEQLADALEREADDACPRCGGHLTVVSNPVPGRVQVRETWLACDRCDYATEEKRGER